MFVDIILPLHLPTTLTYGVPIDLQNDMGIGKRVEVSLGKNKLYAGIVAHIHYNKPENYNVKPIKKILDNQPIVDELQLKFWQWISSYYLAPIGDVMNAALPAHLKLMGETVLVWNSALDDIPTIVDDDTYVVAEALQIKQQLTIAEIRLMVELKNIAAVIDQLLQHEIAYVLEQLDDKYKVKEEKFISLNEQYQSEAAINSLFDSLAKKEKQVQLLMVYLQQAHLDYKPVLVKQLLEQSKISSSVLQTMVKNGIFKQQSLAVDRVNNIQKQQIAYTLLPNQQAAKANILKQWEENNIILLHGVTGSGKTLIYVDIIKDTIKQGKQALLLLPEIMLTTQVLMRLQSYFGAELGVYHSKMSNNERVEIWNKVQQKTYQIIVGPRSAMWLPYQDLGVIIVDEEHESSYKQVDPAPRFHARDSALVLAQFHGAKVLLGSATPSIDTMYNVQLKKYGYVGLQERYRGIALPEIEILPAQNIQPALSQHLTVTLLEKIKENIDQGKQIILFQNKRGYAPFIICGMCGYVPHCKFCDVSLTYHKSSDKLQCHYCGYKIAPIKQCPQCVNGRLTTKNFGTEKVEEDLERIFPKLRIARMDTDSVRTKTKQQQLLEDFDRGRIDILIGTQMIVKGLDFENVGMVGVLSADNILSFPDFRVNERGYQLMEQVSGRAGRLDGKGKVYIQARNIQHPVLQFVKQHNYKAFYLNEIQYRKDFSYPPFARLIKIIIKHRDEEKVKNAAYLLADRLRQQSELYITGPSTPMVSRAKNYYIEEILIKLDKNHPQLKTLKYTIAKISNDILKERGLSGLQINIDVDPY